MSMTSCWSDSRSKVTILVCSNLKETNAPYIMGGKESTGPKSFTSVIFSGLIAQDVPRNCPTVKKPVSSWILYYQYGSLSHGKPYLGIWGTISVPCNTTLSILTDDSVGEIWVRHKQRKYAYYSVISCYNSYH